MARSDWLDPNWVMKCLLMKDHFISDDLASNPNGVLWLDLLMKDHFISADSAKNPNGPL